MEVYYIGITFIFGLLFGSFFNVLGYRLPKEESIVFPASHCPYCNHKLSPLELIPIFSFLGLRGKCRACKRKISWIYPCFELFTGLLFAFSYYLYGFSIDFFIALTIVSTLMVVIISDLRFMIIPDEILIVGTALLFMCFFIKGGLSMCLTSFFNGFLAFLSMFLLKCFGDYLFKKESMGGGDIKLLFFFGFFLGWPMALISIFLASFIGLPISLYILIRKKTNMIPFGPFLSIAALILFFSGIEFKTLFQLLIL